tara:strand:- start:240 stop:500 length:261 start_codon:yes stop_codon:yes gene_type:complete
MKKYWDHSTKPSSYVIKNKDREAFRGTYNDGMMYLRSLECSGMISFKDDYIPAMEKLRKHCQNGYALERTLRREIIKLKKELKCAK